MANGSSQLRIIIDALWRGKGNLRQVRQDLQGVDGAAKKGSAGVDKFSESSETAGKSAQGMEESLGDVVGGLKNLTGAAIGAGATFKQAFDFGRAGAELNQLEDSFERINRDIFQMPTLLEDMRAATRGTVRDADLMSGALTLTAGTSGEMTRALAAATPEILRMSKAANSINPLLGDTTFLFESLSIAAKRQSRLLADNAGIMVSMENATRQVHPALQSLANTYEELPENVRFLNEMLFQGANLVEMAGGAAESSVDSWEQLAVSVRGVRDEWAQLFAENIGPSVAAMAGQNNDAVESIIEGNREAATSYEELLDVIQRTDETIGTGFMAKLAGALDGLHEGQRESIEQAALMASSYEQFESDMVRIFGSVEGAWKDLRATLGEEERTRLLALDVKSLEGWFEYQRALAQTEISAEALREELLLLKQTQAGMVPTTEELVESLKDLGTMTEMEEALLLDVGDATRVYNDLTGEATGKTEELTEAQEEAIEAQERLAQAIDNVTAASIGRSFDLVGDLAGAYDDLDQATGEWSSGYVDRSGEIASINRQLSSDLVGDQKDAWSDILETADEGSQEYLNAYNQLQNDLSESQRQELVVQRAQLEDAHGEFANFYSGDVQAAEEARERIDEINAQIAGNMQQLALDVVTEMEGGWNEVTAAWAVATGVMDEDTAQLRTNVQDASNLVRDIASSGISSDDAEQFIDPLVEAVRTGKENIGTDIDEIRGRFESFVAGDFFGAMDEDTQNLVMRLEDMGVETGLVADEAGRVSDTAAGIDTTRLEEVKQLTGDFEENLRTITDEEWAVLMDAADIQTARDEAIDLGSKLDEAARSRTIRIRIEQESAGLPSVTPETVGGIPEYHGGTGGWRQVPAGQGDYPIHLARGERFNVMTEAQWRATQGGQGGGRPVTFQNGAIQIFVPPGMNNPAAFAKQASGLIMNELNNNLRGG